MTNEERIRANAEKVIETFPVGRRLAFDQTKCYLWVVCRKCEKWKTNNQ